MWTLESIFKSCSSTQKQINGRWVPARPMRAPFLHRFKDAWQVLIGKADAFRWPENQ